MNLYSFEPILEKTSAEYHKSNFGTNYEKLTPNQLRFLIAASGPANAKAYKKGGKGLDDNLLPKKAQRDETGKIIGPGGPPSKPFSRQCPDGDKVCIAKAANTVVQDYFNKVKAGVAPRPGALRKSTSSNQLRKKQQSSHPKSGGVYNPNTGVWQAKRPAGTATQTGTKASWFKEKETEQHEKAGLIPQPKTELKVEPPKPAAKPKPTETPKEKPKAKPKSIKAQQNLTSLLIPKKGVGEKRPTFTDMPGQKKTEKPTPKKKPKLGESLEDSLLYKNYILDDSLDEKIQRVLEN